MSEPEIKQLHVIVHGRVQGVNFRYYTVQTANRLNLTGWVRNRVDGTVEVVAEGARTELRQLEAFLRRGSPSALVTHVETTWRSYTSSFDTFKVRYDYND
ncbi:MAG: acylphosphatase [Anaerolineae bacterium]|nr:acylphosphatase [Anaerolineae bacterium]